MRTEINANHYTKGFGGRKYTHLKVNQKVQAGTVPGGLEGRFQLQVGLSVKVGRQDETFPIGVGGGDEDEVSGEFLIFLHPDDVSHLDIFRLDLDDLPFPHHLSLLLVDFPVCQVSLEVLVSLLDHSGDLTVTIILFKGQADMMTYYDKSQGYRRGRGRDGSIRETKLDDNH